MITLPEIKGHAQTGRILTPETREPPADPPKAFTWGDARDLAMIVRDGLLMIVRGIERKFDIAKK